MTEIKTPEVATFRMWQNFIKLLMSFQEQKKANLRAKIEELETNSKVQNIRDFYRGINDFKKGYQPRCNIVKDEKVDLVADSHSSG